MAANQARWVRNVFGAPEPFRVKGLFQAGATAAIKVGELLEKTADSNTRWVPMDSDYDMTSAAVPMAIADEEIFSGDRAGYYWIVVPRPGDIFQYSLDAADDLALGTALYWSSSEAVTDTAGTNIIGYVADEDGTYPLKQEHLARGGIVDSGETLRNMSRVLLSFKNACSYYSRLFV